MTDGAGRPLAPLARDGGGPLWMQVKTALTGLITGGALTPGARLPSESDLCRDFDVSRSVVREALAQMVHEGLIYRHQGKGAFVRDWRDTQDFVSTTVGFSGELSEKNRLVETDILLQARRVPDDEVRERLKLAEGAEIVVVDRVRKVEGYPRAIIRCSMPADAVPGLEDVTLRGGSLYDTISQRYGIRLTQAERWIEAVSLAGEDADLLRVEPGRAALRIESVGFDARGAPFEYYVATYLTDRSRLHVSVRTLGG